MTKIHVTGWCQLCLLVPSCFVCWTSPEGQICLGVIVHVVWEQQPTVPTVPTVPGSTGHTVWLYLLF